MEEIRKALEDAQGQIATLTSEKKQLLENIKNQKQEISTKEKHIMQAEEEVKKHKLLVEEADKNVKVAKGNAEHLIKSKKGQLVAAERNLGKAQRELKDVKAQHELCAKKIEDFKVAETRKDGEIAKLKKEIEGTEEQVGLHQALEDWKEHQGCAQDIMKLEDDLSDFKEKHKKLKENLQACEAKLRDSEAEKKTLTRATKAQKDKIGRMQKDIDALQNHLKTFEVMQANFNILQYKINALEAARPPPSDIDEVSSFSEDGQKFTPRPLCQELGISSQADSDASAGGTAPEDEVDPQIKSMIENRPKIIPRLKGKIAFSGLTSATGGKITGGETAVASKVAVGQVFNMTKAQRGDVILRVNELPPEKNEEAIKMIHENMKFEVTEGTDGMTAVLDVDKLPNGLLHKLLAIVNKHTPRAAEAPAPVVEKSVDVASSGTAEGLVGSKGPEGKDQDKDQDKNQNKNGESPALAVEKSEDVASGTAESLVSSEGKDQDKNQNKSQNEHDESPAPAVEKSGDASSSGIAEVYCTNQRQKKWQTEHDESPAPAVEKSGDASSSGITEVRSRNKNQNKKQKEHDESPAPANEKSGDTASSGTAEIRSENKNQNEHDESPAPANEKSGDIASSGTAEVLIGSENKNQNKSQTDEHNESSAPALENLGDAASCGTAEVPVYAEGNKQNKKQHEHDEFPAFAIEESSDAASSGTAEVPDVRRAQESLAPSLPVAEVALHTRIYDILRDPLPMIASTLFFLAFIWCLHQVWYARQERQMWMAANQDAIKANVLLRTSPVEIIQRWGWLTPQKVRYLYAAKYTHRHAMYTPMAELKPPTTCTLRYGLYMPLAIVRNRWMQWLHAIPTRASSPTKVAFLTSPTPGATPSFVRMVAARVSGGV